MGKRVKGITIELNGDATGLDKALKGVEGTLKKTEISLKDVTKLLKLDPKNTVLLKQKHDLLQKSIAETKNKLKQLNEANKQVSASYKNYDKWKAAYEPIKAETDQTKKKIEELKASMSKLEKGGKIDTDEYKKLQAEVDESSNHLKELKEQAKAVDEEFEKPISPEKYNALQREIAETKQHLKELEKTSGSASAAMEKISKSAEKFGKKTEQIGKKMMPVTAGVTAIGTASVVTANNFEDAMSQAAGALNKPMEQMGKLRDLAIQMGQETIFSATEAGNAITELAKGGLSEGQIQAGALQTTMDLAAASGMSLGDAANVVVQTMGAFGIEANNSAEAANALAGAAAASSTDVQPLTEALAQCSAGAKNAGWSVQETTAVLGKFADAGITGSDAGTSLKTMLQRLSAPTDKAATMIENLGIQTRDSNGNMLGASEMAEELQNKLGGLDAATRDAALQTIFGSDAMRAAIILTSSGAEGLEKYEKATNDQEAAQRMANSQMGEGSRAIEELKGSLETASIIIGDTLAPIIQKVAEFITDLVNKFTSLPQGVQTVIVVIGALLAAVGPVLMIIGQIALGISAITGVISTVAAPIGAVIIAISVAIATIGLIIKAVKNWGKITEWFGKLWETVKNKCTEIWDTICSFFTQTIPAAWDSLVEKFQSIPEWWSGIWQQVMDFFLGVWNNMMQNPVLSGIVNMITELWANAVATLQNIWENIKAIAGAVWELIKNVILGPVLLLIDLVTGDFENLKSDVQNIWENIKEAASTIWSSLKDLISNLIQGLVTHVVTVVTGFGDTLQNIWNAIKEIAENAWNSLTDFVSRTIKKMIETGIDAFHDMVSGVGDALSRLGEVVENGFQSAIDFITSLPEKAIQWGKDFIDGFVGGIKKAIDKVTDVAKSVADKIRSFLHFSRPDEGPLREYEKWMPDFMEGLSKGIYDNAYKVTDAVKSLSQSMSNNLSMGNSILELAANQNVNVNNAVTVQVGNRQFDSYIVKTVNNSAGKRHLSNMRAKGCLK